MYNIPVIKSWISALRGGEYKQIRNNLRDEQGGRCALGVLDEVVAHAPLESNTGMAFGLGGNYEKDELFYYVNMNDSGYSFADIADELEKNFAPQIAAYEAAKLPVETTKELVAA